MNWAVALALLPLLGLLALASYVDRVYQEIGKFFRVSFRTTSTSSSRRLSPTCM